MRAFTITVYLTSLTSNEVVDIVVQTVKEDEVATAIGHIMRSYAYLISSLTVDPLKKEKP